MDRMTRRSPISRQFYHRDTLDVARDLLGCVLACRVGGKTVRARIVETEAYVGEDDLASHASKGRTKRTEIMYGASGHAYVYMIYGMYHCLNVVTEAEGFPAAVFIRSVEIAEVPVKETNGPGKICRFLGIDRNLNGRDMTTRRRIWIERGKPASGEGIVASARVGVGYAKHCAEYPWRFTLGKRPPPPLLDVR
jgi:DNA-3-methyladenine glycosylase